MNNCLNCNTETNNPKFCSLSCSSKYQNKTKIKEPNIIKKQCLNCKILFLCETSDQRLNKKFCSSSCSATYNNTKRAKKEKNICISCGNLTNNPKYCSTKCYGLSISDKALKDFLLNKNIPDNYAASKSIRIYLMNQQNNKCTICKCDPIHNNKPLVFIMDHIDGNSTNNLPENFRMICPNCDSQLDTYKSKNIGKGRSWRKDRYNQGKSY